MIQFLSNIIANRPYLGGESIFDLGLSIFFKSLFFLFGLWYNFTIIISDTTLKEVTFLKKLFISMAAATLGLLTLAAVATHAQTTTTDLTNPQTDFARDVKNGIDSTNNDAVAQKQQKDDVDNEADEAEEETEKVEVKEVDQETEVPDGVEAKNVDSEGTTKDQINDSSGTGN